MSEIAFAGFSRKPVSVPVISDIVGLKRGQIDGVRDPDADIVELLAVEPGGIKALARRFLERLGVNVQADAAAIRICHSPDSP